MLQDSEGTVNCSYLPCIQQKNFSVTSIPTHSVPETMSGLYELQDAVKESKPRQNIMATSQLRIECVTCCVTVIVM